MAVYIMTPNKFTIRDVESGTKLEFTDTLQGALDVIAAYEAEDKDEGTFEEDCYEVYDTIREEIISSCDTPISVLRDQIAYMVAECAETYGKLSEYQDDGLERIMVDDCTDLGCGYLSFPKLSGFEKIVNAKVDTIDEDEVTDATERDLEAILTFYIKLNNLFKSELGERVITTTKKLRVNGNSITVSLTKEAEMLGLGVGDVIEITIKRA